MSRLWTDADAGIPAYINQDATKTETLGLIAGELDTWVNPGSLGGVATAIGAGNRFTYVADYGDGKPALLSSGSDQMLSDMVMSLQPGSRVFAIVMSDTGSGLHRYLAQSQNGSPENTRGMISRVYDGVFEVSTEAASPATRTTIVYPAASGINSWALVENKDLGAIENFGVKYRISGHLGGEYWSGGIRQIVMLRPETSSDDVDRWRGYLAWRWGLQGGLPANDPYRNAPPMVADGTVSVPVDGASHQQAATSPTAAARSTAQPDSLAQGQFATLPALAAKNAVSVSSGQQAQVADSPSLFARSSATVGSAAQGNAATTSSLSNVRSVASPDAATQAHVSTQPMVQTSGSVVVASVAQTQTATSPIASARSFVTVDDTTAAQAAASPTVAVQGSVMPANSVQAQQATAPAVLAKSTAIVDGCTQPQTTTPAGLRAGMSVVVGSAAQQHSALSPATAAKAIIAPAPARHLHLAISPALFAGTRPVPPSSRTARSARYSRVVRSPRPSRLAA